MLETRQDMTLCGVIYWNDSWEEVYCDDCGVLVFETSQDGGCWCLTEINIGDPLPLPSVKGLKANIMRKEYGEKCIGVIYGNEGNIVVLLDENEAVCRSLADLLEDEGPKFFYCSDEEYCYED